MPYKSDKQRRLFKMCASAKGRKKAKAKCPSKSAVRKFERHK